MYPGIYIERIPFLIFQTGMPEPFLLPRGRETKFLECKNCTDEKLNIIGSLNSWKGFSQKGEEIEKCILFFLTFPPQNFKENLELVHRDKTINMDFLVRCQSAFFAHFRKIQRKALSQLSFLTISVFFSFYCSHDILENLIFFSSFLVRLYFCPCFSQFSSMDFPSLLLWHSREFFSDSQH